MKILPFPVRRPANTWEEPVYRALLENLDALYSTARRLTGRSDLAQDLVQDTATKALQAIPTLKDDRNLRAWLFRILVNNLRDFLRREPDEPLIEPDTLIAAVVSRSATHDIRAALDGLSPCARAVIILIEVQGFTISEAASMLQIPPGTVASRLARARTELRDRLTAYDRKPRQSEGQE